MGVLPLQYSEGETAESLGLTGEETFSVAGLADSDDGVPRTLTVKADDKEFEVTRADRHPEGAGVLPSWRHPEVRPARTRPVIEVT